MIHKMALISVLDFGPHGNFSKDCFTYYILLIVPD